MSNSRFSSDSNSGGNLYRDDQRGYVQQDNGQQEGIEAYNRPYDGYDFSASSRGHSTSRREDYAQIPDELILCHLCSTAHGPRDSSDQAKEEADLSWEPVRRWIRDHSPEEIRESARQRGHHSMIALHMACRNVPPLDVIENLLLAAEGTAEWQDSVGCLPIHYAAACSAGFAVIKTLTDVFPESRTTLDVQGKSPLHYAVKASNLDPSWADVVLQLSSTGAARIADLEGMLVCILTLLSDVVTHTFPSSANTTIMNSSLSSLPPWQPLHHACAYVRFPFWSFFFLPICSYIGYLYVFPPHPLYLPFCCYRI